VLWNNVNIGLVWTVTYLLYSERALLFWFKIRNPEDIVFVYSETFLKEDLKGYFGIVYRVFSSEEK
jgi:hypothetical protein